MKKQISCLILVVAILSWFQYSCEKEDDKSVSNQQENNTRPKAIISYQNSREILNDYDTLYLQNYEVHLIFINFDKDVRQMPKKILINDKDFNLGTPFQYLYTTDSLEYVYNSDILKLGELSTNYFGENILSILVDTGDANYFREDYVIVIQQNPTFELLNTKILGVEAEFQISTIGNLNMDSIKILWTEYEVFPNEIVYKNNQNISDNKFTVSFDKPSTYMVKAVYNNVFHLESEILYVTTCDSEYQSPTEFNTVSDIDGNIYNTVKLGEQWWMAESMKTTKFPDGTAIAHKVSDKGDVFIYEYAQVFNNYDTNQIHFQGICPDGWHIPSDDEWCQLESHLTNDNIATENINQSRELLTQYNVGGKLKSVEWHEGTINVGGTNASKFSSNWHFNETLEYTAIYMSSSIHPTGEFTEAEVINRKLSTYSNTIIRFIEPFYYYTSFDGLGKNYSLCRCVKD